MSQLYFACMRSKSVVIENGIGLNSRTYGRWGVCRITSIDGRTTNRGTNRLRRFRVSGCINAVFNEKSAVVFAQVTKCVFFNLARCYPEGALLHKLSLTGTFSSSHEFTRYGRTEGVPAGSCDWALPRGWLTRWPGHQSCAPPDSCR